MKIRKNSPMYRHLLTKWIQTKKGTIFTLEVIDQLIDSFVIDSKGHIKEVTITFNPSILIDCEELKELDIK